MSSCQHQQQENPVLNTNSSHQVPTLAQQHEGTPAINLHLKQLLFPTFHGNKAKFQEFWGLFQSQVNASNEPYISRASAQEYEEATEIFKTKFGGQIRAYLDELENLPETHLITWRIFKDLLTS